jgi:hypothetical protein
VRNVGRRAVGGNEDGTKEEERKVTQGRRRDGESEIENEW